LLVLGKVFTFSVSADRQSGDLVFIQFLLKHRSIHSSLALVLVLELVLIGVGEGQGQAQWKTGDCNS